MRSLRFNRFAALCGIGVLGLSSPLSVEASLAPPQPLRLVQTIALEGVAGRLDHMAIDLDRQRLFVAALGNGTVEVVDLRSGKRIQSLRGFREPQGLGFVPSPPRLFVANGGDGTCEVLDGASLRRLRTRHLGEDADNVRCDARAGRVYVGYGGGALAVLDADTGDSLGNIALPAHPEAFQLDDGGKRVFVNVPDDHKVAIVDCREGRVAGAWKIDEFSDNFPMAYDGKSHRLFLGCRQPAALLILDEASGKRLSSVSVDGDPDDVFYDPVARVILVSCGVGFIDVLGEKDRGRFATVARMATGHGARTSLFVPELRRLFVAVPHRGSQRAEIRVFEVAP